MLCSDGRGLLDARDGAPLPWLARQVGEAWPLRVLLTPVPVAIWKMVPWALIAVLAMIASPC